jgi:hypothetical protein
MLSATSAGTWAFIAQVNAWLPSGAELAAGHENDVRCICGSARNGRLDSAGRS